MKIFAITDIHGEFYKLQALYQRLNVRKDDMMVFLGDYIDRGEMSFEVINFLIELDNRHNCVFLMGNHENMFMDFMSGIYEVMFVSNGGKKTIDSYGKNNYDIRYTLDYTEREIPAKHLKFFQNLKLYYEIDEFVFVHAGIFPGTPLNNLPKEILLWDRGFAYSDHYEGKTVVFGHTPSPMIMNEKNRVCIDTGACFEGVGYGDLTCAILPERTFIRQGAILEDIYGGNK